MEDEKQQIIFFIGIKMNIFICTRKCVLVNIEGSSYRD